MYNGTPKTSEAPEKRANASFFFSNGQHILIGGGGRAKEYNDIWSLDYTKENHQLTWKKIAQSGAISYTPRTGQAATLCGNKVFLFGGQNFHEGKQYSDAFLYDIENNTWTTLTNKDKPSERNSCTVNYDKDRNRAILLGGADGNGPLNDVYAYDLDKASWQKLQIQGSLKPVGREMHGAIIYNGSLAFPNVQAEPPAKQEKIVELNFTSGIEAKKEEQATEEAGQETAAKEEEKVEEEKASEDKSTTENQLVKANEGSNKEGSYLIIFGGRHREEFSQEILCLDLNTLEWKYLGNMPFTICAHSCELAEDKVFVFAGTDGLQFLDNLYYYNLKTREWFIYKRGKNDNLLPRIAASMSYNPDKKEIVIFAGCSYEDELNDVKILPVDDDSLRANFQKLKV